MEIQRDKLIISIPEGIEVDKENSTFEKIVFKRKEDRPWRDREKKMDTVADEYADEIDGFYIDEGDIQYFNGYHTLYNRNVFAEYKQARSALAMAQISQIMEHDKRFGGVVTDEEWGNCKMKYIICRNANSITTSVVCYLYYFLAFHSAEQRNLFLKENEDLVKQYLMID